MTTNLKEAIIGKLLNSNNAGAFKKAYRNPSSLSGLADDLIKEVTKDIVNKMEQFRITNRDIELPDGTNPAFYYVPQSFVDEIKP